MEAKKISLQSTADLSEPGGGPSESPPSTPSTPSCESAEWEQLSTTGTDQSTLSTEFEVLKGYNRVPIYERRAQWLAEQQARREQKLQSSPGGINYSSQKAFRPNSQLPFPITAQFLRYYGGDSGKSLEQRRSPQSDDSQRTAVAPTGILYTPATTSSYLSTPTSPSSPESAPETSFFTQSRELQEKKRSRPSPPSRKTSGIPSFTSLFESKWSHDPSLKRKNSDYSPNISKEIPTGRFPGLGVKPESKPETMSLLDYWDKAMLRLRSALGYWKSTFFALVVASGFSLAIFFVLITSYSSAIDINIPQPLHVSYNATSSYTRTPYVDFPALMSIESSLERVVESAIGGSTLARLLKQGEMSISDLGTVVKHSDLSCRRTLGERLDRFANDAKEGVISLQLFESKVGEGLDQVLGANQDFLEEFTSQLKRRRRFRYTSVPFVSKSADSPHTRIRLLENFDKTVGLLGSNLETLISSGKRIIKSLDSLSEQHNPIYEEIVREFVNIERREETPWTRIGLESPRAGAVRKLRIRESKDLLALVGSYEEKARGYVENIRLELGSMMGEMEILQRRVSNNLLNFGIDIKANGVTEIPLERQLEAVEQVMASMLNKRIRRTRHPCPIDVTIGRMAKNETGGFRGVFTPTRTSET